MSESPDVLDILRDILETERSFYQMFRFLEGSTRNHLMAAQMRNTSAALSLLRLFMNQPQQTTMVMNIPITMDLSGNFFDPVPVAPTRAQIAAATETHQGVPANTTCAICQDEVACATRIRVCGHTFHGACLDQWFQLNPRCPVCRHDIRDLQSPDNTQ
jgi:hypothetical protein